MRFVSVGWLSGFLSPRFVQYPPTSRIHTYQRWDSILLLYIEEEFVEPFYCWTYGLQVSRALGLMGSTSLCMNPKSLGKVFKLCQVCSFDWSDYAVRYLLSFYNGTITIPCSYHPFPTNMVYHQLSTPQKRKEKQNIKACTKESQC